MLIGRLLENEHDEEPVLMLDEEQFKDESLTDDELTNHLLFEEPVTRRIGERNGLYFV